MANIKKHWTAEKIREGLLMFFEENKRYPTANEIDKYPLLPTSRFIQKKFGGLKKLRLDLGLPATDINYTTGIYRSNLAKEINKRGFSIESKIYDELINYFGEPFVHAEKPFKNSKNRFDFYIYSKNDCFAIDVFYPSDIHSLVGCINHKERMYRKEDSCEIILLQMNPYISQEIINKFIQNKKNKLPANIKIMSYNNLTEFIKTKIPYKII